MYTHKIYVSFYIYIYIYFFFFLFFFLKTPKFKTEFFFFFFFLLFSKEDKTRRYFKPVNIFNYYTTALLKTMKFQSWNVSSFLTSAKNQYMFIKSATDVLVTDSAQTTKNIHVNTHINVFYAYERLLNFFNLTEVPFCIWYGTGLQRQQDYCPDGGGAGTNGLQNREGKLTEKLWRASVQVAERRAKRNRLRETCSSWSSSEIATFWNMKIFSGGFRN